MEKTRLPLLELSPASAGSWLRKPPTPALHFQLNLPGWRWGALMQTPLVAVSRPLHSGVCETRQDAGLPVIHSAISDSGRLRTRGGQPSLWRARCARRWGIAPASVKWRQCLRRSFRLPGRHHSGQLKACQSFAFY